MKGWKLNKVESWPSRFDYANKCIKETVYVVEANSNEVLCFWRELKDKRKWVQLGRGLLETIGEIKIGNKWFPVCLNLEWDIIDGQMVMFYEPTSRIVDHEMVSEWLDLHCDPVCPVCKRKCRCNSLNFHNCLGCIDHINLTK